MTTVIYKIVPAALWAEAVACGAFAGSPVDVRDGFIHFSTGAQAAETAARHFAGVDGLFRFLPDGRSERGYAVLEIGDKQRRVVDPAPESFGAPLTN